MRRKFLRRCRIFIEAMERRRTVPRYSRAWVTTRRLLFRWIGVYTAALGLTVWWEWNASPNLSHAAFLTFALVLWALTMGLLVVGRRVVLTHFVRPLRHRAEYDDLTGVYRPGVFWQQADEVTQTLTACGSPWAFVYLDLDDFKQINDTAGHLTGDAVLRTFGALLKAYGRQEDIIGRLGGEEFGWVLSGCTTEEAVSAANRLLAAFQARPCDELTTTCAFSAGVAGWHENDPVPGIIWDVARSADRALYQAKAQGKGCVAVGNFL